MSGVKMTGREMSLGAARRWFWRIRHRYGDNWSAIPEREIAKEMRMKSWRRTL